MNNMSLEYEGIRLTYGMSIDYFSAPGMEQYVGQRGGTLIAVQQDGTFEIQQVPLRNVEPK